MKETIRLLKSGDREDYLAVFLVFPIIAAVIIILWAVVG
jgi:hypothetical protein